MKKSNYIPEYIKCTCTFIIVPLIVLNWSLARLTNNQDVQSHNSHSNLVQERNDLSILLNKEKQKLGQLQCYTGVVSGSGGWCKNDSSVDSKEHMTDYKLAKYLSNFLTGKRVGSFGDGPGLYKKYLDEAKLLRIYDAYDGAPFAENVTDGRVKFLDLSVPQYGLPLYDWIMSLEVAEHIPSKYEEIFLSNLVRHAKTGIILSWAVPGQGGHFHVNNQPLDYVKRSMKRLGFEHDKEASLLLQSNSMLPWIVENTNIYLRNEPIDMNGL